MSLELKTMLVSLACLGVAAVWILLYWRLAAPRIRQWMRYGLMIGLGWSALALWLINTTYSVRVGWLGQMASAIELWLLIGICISLITMAWLYLPATKVLNRAIKLNYAGLALAGIVVIVAAILTASLKGPVVIAVLAAVGVLGVWRASFSPRYLISSGICLALAMVGSLAFSFGISALWPDMAGFMVGPWWSVLDAPSLVLLSLTAWSAGPSMWWWLGQSTD